MENNELTHYGVVGMRWGIRKAQVTGKPYSYKSHGQKKYDKKVDKYESKGKTNTSGYNKAKDKQMLYKLRDKNRQDYAERTGVGRSILKTALLGPFGNGSYNRMRASGYGRVGSALVSNVILSTAGLPINVLLTRGAEFKTARTQRDTIKYIKNNSK